MRRLLALLTLLAYALSASPQAATPTVSPAAGTYVGSVDVTWTAPTSGALLFCTSDGSAPTLESPQYISPHTFHVTSTTTYQCNSAVPSINATDIQNEPTSGSIWKQPDCQTAAAWSSSTTYTVGQRVSTGGANYIAIAGSTNAPPASSPGSWTNLNCQADDPGGTGVPSPVSFTNGITSPSPDGSTVANLSFTPEPNKQSNVLVPTNASFGSDDTVTDLWFTVMVYVPTASSGHLSAVELDNALFNASNQIRKMMGGQYCFFSCPGGNNGEWDIGGNNNVPWTNTGVLVGPVAGQWVTIGILYHIDPAEDTTKPCVDSSSNHWPYIYYRDIVVNGAHNTNSGAGWKICANALPTGWADSLVTQGQGDGKGEASPVNLNIYYAHWNVLWTRAGSSTANATFTITSGTPGAPQASGRMRLSGNAKF